MKKLLIIEGNSPELIAASRAAGRPSAAEHYGQTLQSIEAELSYSIVEPYRDNAGFDPESLSTFDGAVFTGAAVSWSTAAAQAEPQRLMMERVFAAAIPTLGSCNGMQLANVVLGGASSAAGSLELGLAQNIQLTALGESHGFHSGRISGFSAPCIHRDQVSLLPSGALITAENDHSIQAMVYQQGGVRFWGTQYHPELNLVHVLHYLEREKGIFSGQEDLLERVMAAITDPVKCTAALGGSAEDLVPARCVTELRNWLSSLRASDTEPD